MKNWLLIIGLVGLMVSCKKAEDRKCLKSAGAESSVEHVFNSYGKLDLGPHLIYDLVQDTVNKVIVKGGKNIIGQVSCELVNNVLVIRNENRCNFLRSYKKEITVEIHFTSLNEIHFEGTKQLRTLNQLQLDKLKILIYEGAGNVDLDLVANELNLVITHGWGNYNLHGSVKYMRLEVNSNGFGDSYDMEVLDSLHVISASQDLVKVKCDNALMRAQILQDGDIWYIGTPSFIESDLYGNGELIDKN